MDRAPFDMQRPQLVVATSVALSVVATTLILPILAPLIRQLHLSVTQGGMMLSIGSVAMVIAAPLWGAISDRRGRKATIVVGFVGVLTGYALYTAAVLAGLSGSFALTGIFLGLTASRALTGAFLPAVSASAQALMSDITTADERQRGMAILAAATGVGLVVGPAVSGLLVTRGLTGPLFAAMALCGLGALMASLFLQPALAPAPARARARAPGVWSAALLPWLIAGTATWMAIASVQISAGFYFQDKLGLDAQTAARKLSLALTLVGVAMLGAQLLQVRVLRLAPRRLVLAGAVFWIASMLVLLATANVRSYFLAYALMGLGTGLLLPAVMAGASLAAGHEGQGVAAGLVSAAQGIGFIVGPAASTLLYQWNKALPFWSLAGVMLLLALKFVLLPPRATSSPT